MLPHIDDCGLSTQPRRSTAGVGTGPGRNAGDFLLPPLKTHEPILRVAELVPGARRWCVIPGFVVVVGPRPGEQVVRDIVDGRTPDRHPGETLWGRSGGAAGLPVTECAARLGCTRQALSRLLSDKAGDLAADGLALERAGWSNAAYWMLADGLRVGPGAAAAGRLTARRARFLGNRGFSFRAQAGDLARDCEG